MHHIVKTPHSLIESSSVGHHLYVDDNHDIQLVVSFPLALFPKVSIAQLLIVAIQISKWILSNRLSLNPSETEFVIISVYLTK